MRYLLINFAPKIVPAKPTVDTSYAFAIISAKTFLSATALDCSKSFITDLYIPVFMYYVLSIAPFPELGHPKRQDQYLALCLGPGD